MQENFLNETDDISSQSHIQKNKEIIPFFEPIQAASGFYHSILLINVNQKDKFIEDLRRLYNEAEVTGDI